MQYIVNNGNKNKELLLKHFLELFQLFIYLSHYLSPLFYINFYPLQRATVLLALSSFEIENVTNIKLSFRSNLIQIKILQILSPPPLLVWNSWIRNFQLMPRGHKIHCHYLYTAMNVPGIMYRKCTVNSPIKRILGTIFYWFNQTPPLPTILIYASRDQIKNPSLNETDIPSHQLRVFEAREASLSTHGGVVTDGNYLIHQTHSPVGI